MFFLRAVLTLSIAQSAVAAAQECPLPPGVTAPTLAARTGEERLRFLSATLEGEGSRARLWTGAWGGAYAVLTVAQLVALPLLGPEDQEDFGVGAASTAVGVAFSVVGALPVMDEGPAFAKRAREEKDVCALVAAGEKLLESNAAAETSGTAWFWHAANLGFNVAVGLVLGLGFRHWVSGALNAAVGGAIGEATLLTQPTRLPKVWARYQRGELDAPLASRLHVMPFMTRGGAGLAIAFEL